MLSADPTKEELLAEVTKLYKENGELQKQLIKEIEENTAHIITIGQLQIEIIQLKQALQKAKAGLN